ncbi:MAG: uncharacterized protein JWM40_1735 [Frankiales bacterium]|nr:uncharacterized protein [Frankiales bacterium]MCW2544183.1 uncharacterized protein [Frankiales bacterium]
MAQPEDVLAARNALRALDRALATVSAHYGDSVDAKRLRMDLERVSHDLDLLVGHENEAAAAPRLQVIEDTAYPQDFWMDAEDEGLGGGR